MLVALVGACGDGASADLGLDDVLQIAGAQYRPGPFPADGGGPIAQQITLTHAQVIRGDTRERLTALLDLGTHAGVIGLEGVDGAWIVPAGSPTIEEPDLVPLDAPYAITRDLPLGPYVVELAGVDADGNVGPALDAAAAVAIDAPPVPGTLVVALEWDGDADLDLHVIDPTGGEAYWGHPNTFTPAPGEFVPPDAWMAGGTFDHDGNAGCRRDPDPSEHVAWTMPPPAGAYVIRVDAHAMCGAASAPFAVSAYTNATATDPGTLVGAARGVLVPDDVALDQHDRGAGVLALQFTLP